MNTDPMIEPITAHISLMAGRPTDWSLDDWPWADFRSFHVVRFVTENCGTELQDRIGMGNG